MRRRIWIGTVLASVLMLETCTEAAAQSSATATARGPIYPTAPVSGLTPPGAYAFKDEPVMSVNNSYLGYSNFVDPTYPPPRYINPHAQAQPGATSAPARPRPARWFGFRRRFR